VGTREWLESDGIESSDFAEHGLDAVENFQCARNGLDWLEGVKLGKACETRCLFVDLGVVLHRTRTERVEARFDSVVDVAQVGKVTEQVKFAYFGQFKF